MSPGHAMWRRLAVATTLTLVAAGCGGTSRGPQELPTEVNQAIGDSNTKSARWTAVRTARTVERHLPVCGTSPARERYDADRRLTDFNDAVTVREARVTATQVSVYETEAAARRWVREYTELAGTCDRINGTRDIALQGNTRADDLHGYAEGLDVDEAWGTTRYWRTQTRQGIAYSIVVRTGGAVLVLAQWDTMLGRTVRFDDTPAVELIAERYQRRLSPRVSAITRTLRESYR